MARSLHIYRTSPERLEDILAGRASIPTLDPDVPDPEACIPWLPRKGDLDPRLATEINFSVWWDLVLFMLSPARRASHLSWSRASLDPLGWAVIGAEATGIHGLPPPVSELELESNPLSELRLSRPDEVEQVAAALAARPPIHYETTADELDAVYVHKSYLHPMFEDPSLHRTRLKRADYERAIYDVLTPFYRTAAARGEATLHSLL